jgi:hypothetical protein
MSFYDAARPRLLLHGHIPEHAEIARQEISHHELIISGVQAQIDQLLKQVEHLRGIQNSHRATIAYYKGVISLATRLPSEILATIFECAAQDGWTRAPVVVSQVCSAWRKAAQTPRVWSYLYIDCDSRDPIRKIRNWLLKAKESPLHITLQVEVQDDVGLHSIMELLLIHAPQWRSFTLDSLSHAVADQILSLCDVPMSQLSRVDITVRELGGFPNQEPFQLEGLRFAFRLAPELDTVILSVDDIPAAGTIPSGVRKLSLELRSLDAGRLITDARFIDMLEGLPYLREFSIKTPPHVQRQFSRIQQEPRVVSLVNLESLILNVPPYINLILAHLHAPALRRLSLRSTLDPSNEAHENTGSSLCAFLESSMPRLEFLELHDVDLSHVHFARCFANVPWLQELRLHETEIPDDVFHLLEAPNALCPRLTKLDLRWCGQLHGASILNVVGSRVSHKQHSPSETETEDESEIPAHPIVEVAVINCSHVTEKDILGIAKKTTCRLTPGNDDFCSE